MRTMQITAMIALLIVLIIVGPFLLIWALNTLFPVLDIAYTLETWLASFIISATITAKASK